MGKCSCCGDDIIESSCSSKTTIQLCDKCSSISKSRVTMIINENNRNNNIQSLGDIEA